MYNINEWCIAYNGYIHIMGVVIYVVIDVVLSWIEETN